MQARWSARKSPAPSLRRHEALQLLEPILHDDRFAVPWRTPASAWPLRMIRNRPSGAMSYGRLPTPSGSIADSNNTCGRPATSVVPDCTGTANICRPSGADEEQFPAVPRPERQTRRRPSRSAADFRARDTARRRSQFDRTRSRCRPSSVRLERPPRPSLQNRFSQAASHRTGARWRSARSRTEGSAAPR